MADEDAVVRLRFVEDSTAAVTKVTTNLKQLTATTAAYNSAMEKGAKATGLTVTQLKLLADTQKGAQRGAQDIGAA